MRIRFLHKDFRRGRNDVTLVPLRIVAAHPSPLVPSTVSQPSIVCRARFSGAACTLLLAAACADGFSSPLDPPPPAPVPGDALEVVSCQADVRAGSVKCGPYEGVGGGGVSAARILGGQGINVRLANTNVQYDPSTEIFSMDVTVQNLLAQRLGTPDGTAVTGVTVFFPSEPTVVGSAGGAVSVRNADGEGVFTGSAQSYFHYPQVLSTDAVSEPHRWEFNCSPAVERFTFLVYLRADVLPVIVFDAVVNGNRDIWRVALDGGDLVRLTTHIGDDRNATVGGNRVVFTSYRNGAADLYAVPLAGGAETRVTATAGASETDPALTYDGTRLAFASDAALGVSKVWIANPDGTGAVRATPPTFGSGASPEVSPSWGPRNDRLALVATSGGSADVYDMVLGATPLPLATGTTAEVNPAWSPDGRTLAYVTNLTGAGDVYLYEVEGGQRTRLTTAPEADLYPTWLLDGRIVYSRSLAGGGKELRWLDPASPASEGVVPLSAGMVADRPYAAAF